MDLVFCDLLFSPGAYCVAAGASQCCRYCVCDFILRLDGDLLADCDGVEFNGGEA